MATFNQATIVGNVTRDPEVRYTPKGTAVCEISVAVNKTYTTDEGEKKEDTTFVDVVLWGKLAEITKEYVKKGRLVLVAGELQQETWQDKETGKNRSKLQIKADTIQFLSPPPTPKEDSGRE
jgi:single-strand DNA-binding protein